MAEGRTMFASRLAGLPVLDPAGDRIGRLTDLVIAPRPTSAPVVGAVVRVRRRPIFVSSGRFSDLDQAGLRLSTASVNLRRFERRPGELLVLGELLDRTATLADDGEAVRINDVGISPGSTGRGLVVSSVDVVPASAGLLRRPAHRIVPWGGLRGVTPMGTTGASRAAALANLPPVELAGVMMSLADPDAAQLLAALDDERAADVLEELPEDVQGRLLGTLGRERAGDVLDAMNPDDAADVLGDLPLAVRTALLSAMEPEEAAPVRRLLTYRPDSAGGLMTSEPVVVPTNATVAETLARLREERVPRALAGQAFVVRPPLETPTGRLIGTVSIQRLLRAPPSELAGSHLDEPRIEPLPADLPGPAVAEHLAAYNLLAAPVVDADERLLGAVSVDDVVDFLLPRGWRDAVGDDGARRR